MPIGRFAKTAKSRFACGDRKAKLCDISWIARKRFWLAVAPTTYAVRKKGHDSTGVLRRRYAQVTCIDTTSRTTYLVSGSGPQSLVTYTRVSQEIQ